VLSDRSRDHLLISGVHLFERHCLDRDRVRNPRPQSVDGSRGQYYDPKVERRTLLWGVPKVAAREAELDADGRRPIGGWKNNKQFQLCMSSRFYSARRAT